MTEYHPLFRKKENQILLAVSARRIIKSIAIGGIIWGIINTAIGLDLLKDDALNIGVVSLGVLMFGVGVLTLIKPNRQSLLLEAIAAIVLVCWNVFIEAYTSVQNDLGVNNYAPVFRGDGRAKRRFFKRGCHRSCFRLSKT